jgi:hypothetical protein
MRNEQPGHSDVSKAGPVPVEGKGRRGDDKPCIELPGQLNDITRELLQVMRGENKRLVRYVTHAGRPCRVTGGAEIQALTPSIVRYEASEVAHWAQRQMSLAGEVQYQATNPPQDVCVNLLAMPGLEFPQLEAVIESPVLRVDGSHVYRRGYDAKTGLWYLPSTSLKMPAVGHRPTPKDAKEAARWVMDWFCDFPLVGYEDRANYLAKLLSPLIAHQYPGRVPMSLIDARDWGTGKSLLDQAHGLIHSGRVPEMRAVPGSEQEMRKSILSWLLAGRTNLYLDNVTELHSQSLTALITAPAWSDRVLGVSEEKKAPNRLSIHANGNNIRLLGDLPRRCYRIDLDAKTYQPFAKGGHKHGSDERFLWRIKKERGKILQALLIVARAWYVAGKPPAKHVEPWGTFSGWTQTIGGMLEHAKVVGFLDNRSEVLDEMNEGAADWLPFLTRAKAIPQDWWDVSAIIKSDTLREYVPSSAYRGKLDGRALGAALAAIRGKRWDEHGLRVERSQRRYTGGWRWCVVDDRRRQGR